MKTIPQGQPIPFTWTFPEESGLDCADFDECENAIVYLYTQDTQKFKYSLRAKDEHTPLVKLDPLTLYGQITRDMAKVIIPGDLKIEVALTDIAGSVYPKQAAVSPAMSTGIKITRGNIKDSI